MEVINHLRIKFIYSMILIEMIVFAAIIITLDASLTHREMNEGKQFLSYIAKNGGHRPPPMRKPFKNSGNGEDYKDVDTITSASPTSNPKSSFYSLLAGTYQDKAPGLRNYFAVRSRPSGEIIQLVQDFPLNYEEEEIYDLVNTTLTNTSQCAVIDGIMYYIYGDRTSSEFLICYLNMRAELQTIHRLYFSSFLVYIASIILSFLISLPISKYMVRPAEEALIKQKAFIADAGHELKTPIAVISANIDVLENEIKDNKWLKYIKNENQRMGELVKDLLYLAKNDAGRNEVTFSDFDFSNAVENSVLPFEVLAFESEKELSIDIHEKIICHGDEKSIKHIFGILVDNAIKNSEKGAKITIKAYTEGQKIYFKVHNTGAGIAKEELEKIFQRFYRSDSSRARKTGGYGLGLAIARAIAQDHNGSLVASSEVGKWAEFTLCLPRKK